MKRLLIAVLAMCMVLPAVAADRTADSTDVLSATARILRDDADERRAVSLRLAPIASKAALNAYRVTPVSPLHALSPGARERFLSSLTFNQRGLTGFQYTDLEAELTPTQIYRVLSLFGAQDMVGMLRSARVETELDRQLIQAHDGRIVPMADHMEYACVGRATCELSPTRICMSSCIF